MPGESSTAQQPAIVTDYLTTVVALRRKAGLFSQPPFSIFVGLPMGMIYEKCSLPVKYHIIHDWPWHPGIQSMSILIPSHFGFYYVSLAFKHKLICPEDWPLLSSTWEVEHPDYTMQKDYYVELSLHRSPLLSNEYSHTLKNALKVK